MKKKNPMSGGWKKTASLMRNSKKNSERKKKNGDFFSTHSFRRPFGHLFDIFFSLFFFCLQLFLLFFCSSLFLLLLAIGNKSHVEGRD